MSKINAFELQVNTYLSVVGGTTSADIRNELWGKFLELRHLIGDGNPSHKDFKEEIRVLVEGLSGQVSMAEEVGGFAATSLKLKYDALSIAGEMVRDIVEVVPSSIPEAEEIGALYHALQQMRNSPNRGVLRGCDALLKGKFCDRLDALYGVEKGEEDQE